MDLKQIRYEARRKILDDKVNVWLLWLVVLLINGAVSAILSRIDYIGWILSLVAVPLTIGVYLIGQNILKGKPIDFKLMLEGYKDFKYALYYILLNIVIGLIIFGGLILLIVPGIVWALKYSQAPFIYIENKGSGMKISDALRQSAAIMDGHKKELFILCLSFIGHFLLSIITFGIWFLYLLPYMELAIINYHVHLTNNE